jgi:uncharacterized protein YodC (DUF2158 family)
LSERFKPSLRTGYARGSKHVKWKRGDVVKLRTGGPRMTVQSDVKDGMVGCSWFDSHQRHHKQEFAEESLISPEDPPKVTFVPPKNVD